MAKKLIKLPSLSRVVAGATATLELPLGPTYKRIIFVATGTGLDVTDIGRIDMLINGKVIQTVKNLQRLFDLNSYYNRAADTAAQFVWHFERNEAHAIEWRRGPGLGTANVQTAHMEIALVAAAPADITLVAYAEIDTIPQPLGAFVRIREIPYSSSVSGEVEVDRLPRGNNYMAIHCFKSDVNSIELLRNGTKIMEATKGVLERMQKDATPVKRVPVTASATHVDMMTEGDFGQTVETKTASDYRLKMNLGTSGSVDIVTETIETAV